MYAYRTFTVVTDNGPYITKLILHAPTAVNAAQIQNDTFNVYVERKDPETKEVFMASRVWLGPKIYPSRGYREVTAAYPCDENGNKLFTSEYIALEMPYGPLYPIGYAQAAFRSSMNEFIECDYRITQVKEITAEIPIAGWVFDKSEGDICPQLKGWANDKSHDKKMPLGYGYFTPDRKESEKNFHRLDSSYGDEWVHEIPEKLPLVVWLHGLGEGGSDPTVAYTGNKVVNLSSPDIQNKLGGAAYILCPQADTFWMDDGYKDKPHSHIHLTNNKSKYTRALKACIDEFIELHPDIDTDRIYIGGCSNGGFMTMRMIISYPDFFAAAFPTCEAYRTSDITEEDIANLKHLPIWFTNAEDDPLVPPEGLCLATYRRLKEAGAENVHVSLFEKIVDRSGLFKNEAGEPYRYNGHFSWVYVYNDYCEYDLDGTKVMIDNRPVSLFRWLGKQKRR
ncbi:MAG: prolyl oligopeptidase family serine peptidase [Solobacterium sp.]|nr:prolyl oligopeptidase family serine peptidase [Solobacterium sp.]